MVAFDFSILSPSRFVCAPKSKQPDPETGCGPFCGDDRNIAYEQCRQTYFIKQQNEILKQQNTTNQIKEKNQGLINKVELIQKENTELRSQIGTLQKENQPLEATIQKWFATKNNINYLLISAVIVFIVVLLAVKFIGKPKNK